MNVLVVNAGSSSLKLRVLDDGDVVRASRDVERSPDEDVVDDLDAFLADAPQVEAAGHRVVHGGSEFDAPLVVDARSDAELSRLAELAPLHNPPALGALHALRRARPTLAQVACFDTSFHARMPRRASTYALPRGWREDLGVRKFGFHGLSHAWASKRAAELLALPLAATRLVTAHIGAGASLCAVAGGRSVDTTMGFTPMDGLVMATRPGSLDPGAVLWAMTRGGMDAKEVESDLEHRAGLLGLTGRTGDLRAVIAGADAGDDDCALAYEVYVYRLRLAVGSMAVALGGMDALVFTGGAGERSARLRADVCRGLGALGVAPLPLPTGSGSVGPDGAEGRDGDYGPGSDRVVSEPAARPSVLVVEAREDVEIARAVREVLSSGARRGRSPSATPEP